MRLGADVPALLDDARALVTGAGEHVEPLAGATPSASSSSRSTPSSTPARSTARSTCSATPRSDAELDELAAAAARRRAARRPSTTSSPPPARLCPKIDPALEALRAAGAEHPMVTGSGPTVFGRRERPGARRRAPARGRRPDRRPPHEPRSSPGSRRPSCSPAGCSRAATSSRAGSRSSSCVAIAGALPDRPRRRPPARTSRSCSRTPATALGAWTYLLVGALAFARDRRVHRLHRAGRDGGARRRPRRRPGPDLAARADRDRLGLRGARRRHVLRARPPPRPRVAAQARRAAEDHRGRAWTRSSASSTAAAATTIIVGRFIGFVRPIMPFIAGASQMPLRRFLPYDVLGAGAWATTFCVLGYVFWRSIDQLTTYVSRAGCSRSGRSSS